MGGNVTKVDDRPVQTQPSNECPSLYAHFAQLVCDGSIDVDLAPLQLVGDGFVCGQRIQFESFVE
jgi:D-galactose 1-dehydrogenase